MAAPLSEPLAILQPRLPGFHHVVQCLFGFLEACDGSIHGGELRFVPCPETGDAFIQGGDVLVIVGQILIVAGDLLLKIATACKNVTAEIIKAFEKALADIDLRVGATARDRQL